MRKTWDVSLLIATLRQEPGNHWISLSLCNPQRNAPQGNVIRRRYVRYGDQRKSITETGYWSVKQSIVDTVQSAPARRGLSYAGRKSQFRDNTANQSSRLRWSVILKSGIAWGTSSAFRTKGHPKYSDRSGMVSPSRPSITIRNPVFFPKENEILSSTMEYIQAHTNQHDITAPGLP